MTVITNHSLTTHEIFQLDAFAPHLAEEFSVLRGAEWVTVTLAEATASYGHQPVVGESFSLIFTAGPEKPLQQGIHEFQHAVLGRFELFITPVMSAHAELRCYQAVINRQTFK